MIPKKIFYYWEGTRYPYINYCLKSIEKRCGVESHFITQGNVRDYIKGVDLADNWANLRPISQRIDVLRVALLYKYGGCWMDADTVMLKDMNSTFENLQEADIICMRWRRTGRILNGYFFANQGSEFLRICLDWINKQLRAAPNQTHYPRHQGVWFGEHMVGQMHYENPKHMRFVDPEIFLPIQFPFQQNVWWQNSPIEPFFKTNTIAIGMNHSQYADNIRNMTMPLILRGKNVFSNIFKYSEQLGSII